MFVFGVVPGQSKMFVIDADDPSRSVQVSTNGGRSGFWDKERACLYCHNRVGDDSTLCAVDNSVREDGSFVPSAPEPLLPFEEPGDSRVSYAAPNGEGFIRSHEVERNVASKGRVVQLLLDVDQELAPLPGNSPP